MLALSRPADGEGESAEARHGEEEAEEAAASIGAVHAFVDRCLRGGHADGEVDPSHDLEHCCRVVRLAQRIARAELDQEGTKEESTDGAVAAVAGCQRDRKLVLSVVELGALMHDVLDSKLVRDAENADVVAQRHAEVRALVQRVLRARFPNAGASGDSSGNNTAAGQDADGDFQREADEVVDVVQRCGYRKRVREGEGAEMSFVLRCVSDADLLDATGTIGVARCFTFGGRRGRPFYSPRVLLSQEDVGEEATAVEALGEDSLAHFMDKLCKLPNVMRTDTGRELARVRHERLMRFYDDFVSEVRGES